MLYHILTKSHLFFLQFTGHATAVLALSENRNLVPGTGLIWLDNVICLGNEESLDECYHQAWGQQDHCNHQKDVAIRCSGKHTLGFTKSVRNFKFIEKHSA